MKMKSPYLQVLEEFRVGQCSDDTDAYITEVLSKLLKNPEKEHVVHLCFTRLEEEFQNATKLHCFEGVQESYVSQDQGSLSQAQSVIPKTIYILRLRLQ